MFLIVFNALLSPWLVLALLAPLALLLLWIEWRRKHRFVAARLFAVMVMVLSMAAILLRPAMETTVTRQILLLTPGYTSTIVDSLLVAHRGLQVKHAPGTAPYKNSTILRSYRDLADGAMPVQFVVGEGMPATALDIVKHKFAYLPPPPHGIRSLQAGKATVYQAVQLSGTFAGDGKEHIITVAGPGGAEDSVRISGQGNIPFALKVTPRQAGNFLYTIRVRQGDGASTQETFPLTVAPFEPLAVLFLEPYPTFEAQYLKNYLAAKGHSVVLRYELSKNTFRYEYANHAPVTVSRLTPDGLSKFDVVLAEADVLHKLSPAERRVLTDAIAQGLGYITLGPVETNDRALAGLFPFETVPVKNDTAQINLHAKLQPLPALRWRVKDGAGVEALLQNKNGVLAATTPNGAGQIGVQVLQETYRLALAGDSTGYSAVWAPLIQHIARTKATESTALLATPLPTYPDEPVRLRVVSSQPNPAMQVDSVTIPLREDVLIDGVWQATTWNAKPGWHKVTATGAEPAYYFVHDEGSWPTLRSEMLRMANSAVAGAPGVSNENMTALETISPLWFFLLFVLAGGFIWLSPKL